MIYDSEREKVPLKEEVAYIESYISLQKLRVANESKITFDLSGNIDSKQIAPMLLITFIENAFKHSSLRKTENSIIIRLDVLENQINFSCINSLYNSPVKKDESKGIGLELIKKRLELIYPKSYELKIDQNKQNFAVELKIKTNAN
jgi:LytS/YehU family sensor histidine kinase